MGELVVHHDDLQDVLGEGANLDVVVVRLGDAAKEGHWARELHVPLEMLEHELLSLDNLISIVSLIHHVDHLGNSWGVDLLKLGRKQEGSGADELKLAKRNHLLGQEAVDVVDGKKQGLWKHGESLVDLDDPIQENTTHVWLDLGLEVLHVRLFDTVLQL